MRGGLPTTEAEIAERLKSTSDVMFEAALERENESVRKLEGYLATARLRRRLILDEVYGRATAFYPA